MTFRLARFHRAALSRFCRVRSAATWSTSLATGLIMRKIPYLVTLIPVVLSLLLSLISFVIPEWVYAETDPDLPIGKVIRWGLYERCERTHVQLPDGKYESQLHCREFPSWKYDDCEKEIDNYCVLWSTATYASELSLVFLAATIVALLLVTTGFGTRARRRTAWQGVVALMGLHGALQITTMAIVAHLHRTSANPMFHKGSLSTSFYFGTTSWVLDVFTIVALIYTAYAAQAGERWAAGRRGYQTIPG